MKSWIVAAAVICATVACAPAAAPPAAAPPAAQGGDTLERMADCAPAPAGQGQRGEVARFPDGSVVTDERSQPPLRSVEGYVPAKPAAVREAYEQRSDIQLISAEDEGFEAEVLFTAEGKRVYVKALAICESGSQLSATISPLPE